MAGKQVFPKILPKRKRYWIRQKFASSLWNAGVMDVFWLPTAYTITTRRVNSRTREQYKLPPDAVALGRYASPYSPATFVNDLDTYLFNEHRRQWDDPR